MSILNQIGSQKSTNQLIFEKIVNTYDPRADRSKIEALAFKRTLTQSICPFLPANIRALNKGCCQKFLVRTKVHFSYSLQLETLTLLHESKYQYNAHCLCSLSQFQLLSLKTLHFG